MSVFEWGGCLLLCLTGGLDRTAWLQVMVARPIVLAPLAGWWLGAPDLGLRVGLALELVFLARLPVGATVPNDDTQMALGAVVVATMAERNLGLSIDNAVALGLLMALSAGYAGGLLERWARHQNARLVRRAEEAVSVGNYSGFQRCHRTGLLYFSAASLVAFGLICGTGWLVLTLAGASVRVLVDPIATAIVWILPLCGVAAFLAQHRGNRYGVLYMTAFGGLFLWLWGAG